MRVAISRSKVKGLAKWLMGVEELASKTDGLSCSAFGGHIKVEGGNQGHRVVS